MYCTSNPKKQYKVPPQSLSVEIHQHDTSLMEQDKLVSFIYDYKKWQLMFSETMFNYSRAEWGLWNAKKSEAFCLNPL